MESLSAVRHGLLKSEFVVVGEKYNTNHRVKTNEI
jgi:hypothetical protein